MVIHYARPCSTTGFNLNVLALDEQGFMSLERTTPGPGPLLLLMIKAFMSYAGVLDTDPMVRRPVVISVAT
jgi:hypothetical protein